VPGDRIAPQEAGGLLVSAMNVAPEAEAEFNRWYDTEHLPNLADRTVDAVVGIEEDAFAPDSLDNFFAGDELTLLLNQDDQDLEGKPLQFEETSRVAKFERSKVDLEILPESDGFLRSGQT